MPLPVPDGVKPVTPTAKPVTPEAATKSTAFHRASELRRAEVQLVKLDGSCAKSDMSKACEVELLAIWSYLSRLKGCQSTSTSATRSPETAVTPLSAATSTGMSPATPQTPLGSNQDRPDEHSRFSRGEELLQSRMSDLSAVVDDLRSQIGTTISKHVKTTEDRDRDIACVLGALQAQVNELESYARQVAQDLVKLSQSATAVDSCYSGLHRRCDITEKAVIDILGLEAGDDVAEALRQSLDKETDKVPASIADPEAAPTSSGLQGVRQRLLSIRASIASRRQPVGQPNLSARPTLLKSLPWGGDGLDMSPGSYCPPSDPSGSLLEETPADSHPDIQSLADEVCSPSAYNQLGDALISEAQAARVIETVARAAKEDGKVLSEEIALELDFALDKLRTAAHLHIADIQDAAEVAVHTAAANSGNASSNEEERTTFHARLSKVELRISQLAEEPLRQAGCDDTKPGHVLEDDDTSESGCDGKLVNDSSPTDDTSTARPRSRGPFAYLGVSFNRPATDKRTFALM